MEVPYSEGPWLQRWASIAPDSTRTFPSPRHVLLCLSAGRPQTITSGVFSIAFFGKEGVETPAPSLWGVGLGAGQWPGGTAGLGSPSRPVHLATKAPLQCGDMPPTWGTASHFLESTAFRVPPALSSLDGIKPCDSVEDLALPHGGWARPSLGAPTASLSSDDAPLLQKACGAIFPTAFAQSVSVTFL